jgi:hypothetical protein
MKLVCKKCNSQIKAENINIKKGWGYCLRCNELTPIDGRLNPIETRPATSGISEIKLNDDSIGLLFPLKKQWGIFFIISGVSFGGWPLIHLLSVLAESNGDFYPGLLEMFSLLFVIGLSCFQLALYW